MYLKKFKLKNNKIISILVIAFVAVLLFLSLQTTTIKDLNLTTISGEKITSQQPGQLIVQAVSMKCLDLLKLTINIRTKGWR